MIKNKKLYSIIILSIAFCSIISFSGQNASAQDILPGASGSSDCTTKMGRTASDCGDYTVNDFVRVAINVSNWILGIVGSLTLLMFVYGGFMFLISAGSSDKVAQAKKILTAAIVGLIIVFASYAIMKFVLKDILGVNSAYTSGAIPTK